MIWSKFRPVLGHSWRYALANRGIQSIISKSASTLNPDQIGINQTLAFFIKKEHNTTINTSNRNPSREENKLAAAEKARAQDAWRRIVVKVISWSNGLKSGGIIKAADTISKEEWQFYHNKYLQINTGKTQEKLEERLKETKKLITSFGGFKR